VRRKSQGKRTANLAVFDLERVEGLQKQRAEDVKVI
jgi:hypothetical protein